MHTLTLTDEQYRAIKEILQEVNKTEPPRDLFLQYKEFNKRICRMLGDRFETTQALLIFLLFAMTAGGMLIFGGLAEYGGYPYMTASVISFISLFISGMFVWQFDYDEDYVGYNPISYSNTSYLNNF